MDAAAAPDDVPAGPVEDAAADPVPPVAPGSLGPHPDRHPDDLPPPEPGRRRLPAGILWAVALALVVLIIASWTAFSNDNAGTPTDPDLVRLGDPSVSVVPELGDAPDLVGQPISALGYQTFDGASTNLAAQTGTPMVVNFWASYCTPCIAEMPAFEAVHQDLGDQVRFIGLAVSDPEPSARGMAETTGVTYDLGFDRDGQIILAAGGVRLPTTVFVSADGTILETHNKDLDEAELRARIDQHFGVAGTG